MGIPRAIQSTWHTAGAHIYLRTENLAHVRLADGHSAARPGVDRVQRALGPSRCLCATRRISCIRARRTGPRCCPSTLGASSARSGSRGAMVKLPRPHLHEPVTPLRSRAPPPVFSRLCAFSAPRASRMLRATSSMSKVAAMDWLRLRAGLLGAEWASAAARGTNDAMMEW